MSLTAKGKDFDLLAKQRSGLPFTPDLWRLEQSEYQLLFIVDNLMQRHSLHDEYIKPFIYKSKPLAAGFTAEDYWGMWKLKLGKYSFPIPLINKNKSNTAWNKIGRIKGELVAIRPYMFIDLDKHYQNRLEFNRIRTNIVVPNRKRITTEKGTFISPELTETVRAWMYIGIPSFWEDQLDGGLYFKPVSCFTPRQEPDKWVTGNYFYWSLNEYDEEPTTHFTRPEDNQIHKQITFTMRNVQDN